jgi:hypothetical protein
VAYRLRNEGLLIQGTHISVLNGDVPIVQRPPFVVYSNKVVKITKDEEEISFKPTIDFAEQRIEVTRVNGLNVARLSLGPIGMIFMPECNLLSILTMLAS